METTTDVRSDADPLLPAKSAIDIVCAKHLHQVFWLPKNEFHERLRVTYATTSNFLDTTLPVLLVCPPMFGGRWMMLHFDHLAKTNGLSAICFDRPGMGGSTAVPLEIRMKVWLETVPALLGHLNVKSVSLLSHSAGTLYALNTLYYLRDILHPNRPYIAMIAPWVHNAHSNATLMNMASKIPVTIVNSWHNVIKFAGQNIGPAVAWSGGVSSSVSSMFRTSPDSSISDSAMLATKFGTSEKVAKDIEKLATKYFFAEDVSGGTEEAKMCLKKGEGNLWLICEDYKQYVQSLLTKEEESANANADHTTLKIRVFYAESDIMIGGRGREYFEECWRIPDVPKHIDFDSQTLPGTDHETAVADIEKGAMPSIFEEINRTSQEDSLS